MYIQAYSHHSAMQCDGSSHSRQLWQQNQPQNPGKFILFSALCGLAYSLRLFTTPYHTALQNTSNASSWTSFKTFFTPSWSAKWRSLRVRTSQNQKILTSKLTLFRSGVNEPSAQLNRLPTVTVNSLFNFSQVVPFRCVSLALPAQNEAPIGAADKLGSDSAVHATRTMNRVTEQLFSSFSYVFLWFHLRPHSHRTQSTSR